MKRIALIAILVTCFPAAVTVQGETKAAPERAFDAVVTVRGTGQTTGHIATITFENSGQQVLSVLAQSVFIPSVEARGEVLHKTDKTSGDDQYTGRYQSYVGRIPGGITVPPGASVEVPVEGYCIDVHAPPVPDGEPMPPLEDWVPVGTPTGPDAGPGDAVPVALVAGTPVAPFNPSEIPGMSTTIEPRPTPATPSEESGLTATFPGTDIAIPGKIDPDTHRDDFAPLVVAVVEQVEAAAEIVQSDPDITTPFSNDPEKERESIIQQTIWIATAIITGEPYEKDDFADNVYEQFEASSGVPVASVPPEDKEQIDAGVNDFWNAFVATGTEAKVLTQQAPAEIGDTDISGVEPHVDSERAADAMGARAAASGDSISGTSTPSLETAGHETIHAGQNLPAQASPVEGASSEEGEGVCTCQTISFDVSRMVNGLPNAIGSASATEFTAAKNRSVKMEDVELEADDFTEFELKVHNVKVKCECSTGGICPFYPDDDAEADARNTAEIEIEAQGAKISDESASGGETSFTVTPNRNAANAYVYFKIVAFCVTEVCEEAKCQRWFRVQFKPEKEEDKKEE